MSLILLLINLMQPFKSCWPLDFRTTSVPCIIMEHFISACCFSAECRSGPGWEGVVRLAKEVSIGSYPSAGCVYPGHRHLHGALHPLLPVRRAGARHTSLHGMASSLGKNTLFFSFSSSVSVSCSSICLDVLSESVASLSARWRSSQVAWGCVCHVPSR